MPAHPDPTRPLTPMNYVRCMAFLVSLSLAASGCRTMGIHQANGTALGALSGTALGASVGQHAGGKTLEGALLGGLAGAAIGNQVGESLDRSAPAIPSSASNGLAISDIVRLHQSGATADIIIRQIGVQGLQRPIDVDDILALQQAGVDAAVIQAAQTYSANASWNRPEWRPGPQIIGVEPGCPGVEFACPPPVYYRRPPHSGFRMHWRW